MGRIWEQTVVSPSKSFAAALVCFSLGVGVAPALGAWTASAYALAVAVVGLVAWALTKDKGRRLLAACLALFVLGAWRYWQAEIPPEVPTVADAAGRATRISGIVASEVETRMSGARAVIDAVRVADAPVDGRMLLWFPTDPGASYGDTLTFSCAPELPEPIGTFRYDRYLRSQGILSVCSRPQFMDVVPARPGVVGTLLSVKRVIVGRLGAILPEPHASFVSGLLFGGSSALSRDLKDDFASTGTSHILAASGFNVSLFTMAFLTWITHTALGRRRGAYLTAALLVAYVLVAGATAAVVRAGIMGGVVLLGFVVRRKPSVRNMMLLALAVMLAFNPLLLWDDVGFQLSFVATAAMLGLASRVEARCGFVPEALGLRASFAASLAAIVATLPVMLWHFGGASFTAPFANLLVLPLVPLLMALSAAALAVAFVSPAVGTVLALPAWAVSSVVLHVVTWFGAL